MNNWTTKLGKKKTDQRFNGKNLYNSYKFSNFASIMPFPIHIDILDFIFKGILIGVIASAPMGRSVCFVCSER